MQKEETYLEKMARLEKQKLREFERVGSAQKLHITPTDVRYYQNEIKRLYPIPKTKPTKKK